MSLKEKFMPLARKLVLGSVAAVAIAGAAYGLTAFQKPPTPAFETVPVGKERVEAKITASGTLSALVTVQVGSQVSGRIASLGADFNARVKKGQVLAKLDPQLFQAAYEQAKASDLAARSNLARNRSQAWNAEQQLKRTRALWQRQLIAQAELDTAQSTYDAAKAQVDAAQASVDQTRAQLNQAKINLSYTTIVSPIDGIVISRNVDVGQTVAASLQAPTLFVIAQDLKKEQVDASIAEADVGKLKPGMSADFTVAAFPNDKFTGTIRQVRNAAQTQQNVVTYDAVIDVENPEQKLRPGMTANVSITYAVSEDQLTVPNTALRFKPPQAIVDEVKKDRDDDSSNAKPESNKHHGGHHGHHGDHRKVWILNGGKPEPCKIKVGITDGTNTVVTDGNLKENDLVITDLRGESGADKGSPGGERRPRKRSGIF